MRINFLLAINFFSVWVLPTRKPAIRNQRPRKQPRHLYVPVKKKFISHVFQKRKLFPCAVRLIWEEIRDTFNIDIEKLANRIPYSLMTCLRAGVPSGITVIPVPLRPIFPCTLPTGIMSTKSTISARQKPIPEKKSAAWAFLYPLAISIWNAAGK